MSCQVLRMYLDDFIYFYSTWRNHPSGVRGIIILFKESRLKQQMSILSNSYTSAAKLMGLC